MVKTASSSAFVALLALAVLFIGGVSVASAATFTNVEFQNGDVQVQGTGGSTVTAKVRVVIPANEVVERIQTDVISDNLAPVCIEVGGDKGLEEGTHFVDLQVKLPPNTGTFNLAVQGSGIFGAFRTVDCTSNVVGNATFNGALKVVGSSSGSGTVGGSSFIDELLAMIKSLQAQIAALQAGPVKPSYCSGMVNYTGSNAWAAQAWLLSRSEFNSGFHSAGVFSPTGYWGSISQSAYAQAQSACK